MNRMAMTCILRQQRASWPPPRSLGSSGMVSARKRRRLGVRCAKSLLLPAVDRQTITRMSESLVERLVSLSGVASRDPDVLRRSEKLGSLSYGALYDFALRSPLVAEVADALLNDAEVADLWSRGKLIVLPTGGGTAGLLPGRTWLPDFLWHAVAQSDDAARADVAREFLATARLSRGAIPVSVSHTMVGFRLPNDDPVELEIGWLRNSVQSDLGIPFREHTQDMTGVVYGYVRDIPARIAPMTMPETVFTPDEAEAEWLIDDHLFVRVLLALALETATPVREHMLWRRPLYLPGAHGRADEAAGLLIITPASPAVLTPGEVARVVSRFEELLQIDVAPLAAATRRYLLARSERVRPTDQLVDLGVALEALSGLADRGKGPTHSKVLASLISHDPHERDRLFDEDLKYVRACREAILHRGERPANTREMATLATQLVRAALLGRIATLAGHRDNT